jgi:methylenetetrahydrofolate dehydrogenase (NADP+)/methenyltetrahydrofolate cyclohydrolase
MQLDSKELLEKKNLELKKIRDKISAKPGIALIWIGDDPQTATFVRVKQRAAQELNCQFNLHHFDNAESQQIEALVGSLNMNKATHGIVIQLPIPSTINVDRLLNIVSPQKDIDGLKPSSSYPAPTAKGIVDLIEANKINPGELKTVILGAGRLVGAPLAKMFTEKNWRFIQIDREAEKLTEEIKSAQLLIACTGVNNLITPAMLNKEMIVIDGSGIDVDAKAIEPLVKAVTPTKGAIGPLTVANLFENLLVAASS